MALGIVLAIAAYGITNKNKALGIISVIVLIMIIAIGVYFYINPY